jgi:hypothetical protein
LADFRHLAYPMLLAAACSPPVHADPMAQPLPRPRIELRTVKHGWGTIIGAYVRDNELKEPVAPAHAEDGKIRWLPVEDWAPSATPAPRSVHSAELSLWLDPACSIGFAVTPATTKPRYVWRRVADTAWAVWRVSDWRPAASVARYPMWSGADARKCVSLTSAERDQKLAGRGAWEVTERLLPDRFAELQYTETSAEQSVTPTFIPITSPTMGLCAPCEVGDYMGCGGNPARCYKPDGASHGCCVQ